MQNAWVTAESCARHGACTAMSTCLRHRLLPAAPRIIKTTPPMTTTEPSYWRGMKIRVFRLRSRRLTSGLC